MANDDTTQLNGIAPIQSGSAPFIPFGSTNKNTQQDSQSISVSSESGPIIIKSSEASSGTQEYGYDGLKQLEQKAEQEVQNSETAERKEGKSPIPGKNPQDNQKSDDTKKISVPVDEKPVSDFPKFQGHKISEATIADTEHIKNEAGKGNANKSQTAIYIFLDRLLKKQSANSK